MTARLLRLVANRQLDPSPMVTHTFELGQMLDAYAVFSRPEKTGALKMICSKC